MFFQFPSITVMLQDPATAATSIGSRTTSFKPCKRELHLTPPPALFPRMSEFTDPSKAAALFSSGSANAVSFDAEAIWGVPRSIPEFCVGSFLVYILVLSLHPCAVAKEMTKFMVAVCLNQTSCAAPAVNDSSVAGRDIGFSFPVHLLLCFCGEPG